MNSHDPMRVLLLEGIHPSAEELLRADGLEVESLDHALLDRELIARLAGVHVLGLRSKTRLSAAVLGEAKELLAAGCFCIGTDQVDLAAACARGVAVFNAPLSNTRSVAELMIAEIIALARQLGDRSRDLHAGRWCKSAASSYEVRGKTVGIIGYGHIGSQVGVLAEALGLRVIFYDVVSKLPMGNNRPCASLAEILRQADFVCLHVPGNERTASLIDASALAAMKPGSYLLNASRGSVVDTEALAAALARGHIAGAAVDVYPEEPEGQTDSFTSELQGLSNVILTPHIGGSTLEAQAAIGREVSSALDKFLRSGTTVGSVNFPEVELAPSPGTHRIVNVHKNVPGVLRDINKIVSDCSANIHSQVLATNAAIGYLIMDLDQDVSAHLCAEMARLDTNLRTRVV